MWGKGLKASQIYAKSDCFDIFYHFFLKLIYIYMPALCVLESVIYCIGFYLWNEETHWAAFTLGLFLPGTAVQLLSVKWYYDDGDDRRCYLSVIHILHLGIFKR